MIIMEIKEYELNKIKSEENNPKQHIQIFFWIVFLNYRQCLMARNRQMFISEKKSLQGRSGRTKKYEQSTFMGKSVVL